MDNSILRASLPDRNIGAEVFKLDCADCRETVEFPTETVVDGIGQCPRCGARFTIQWRAEAKA